MPGPEQETLTPDNGAVLEAEAARSDEEARKRVAAPSPEIDPTLPAELAAHPELANVMVSCPIPGKQNGPPQPLSVFMKSEVGKRVGTNALELYDMQIKDSEADKNEALSKAFMYGIVLDEKDKPVQATEEQVEQALEVWEAEEKAKSSAENESKSAESAPSEEVDAAKSEDLEPKDQAQLKRPEVNGESATESKPVTPEQAHTDDNEDLNTQETPDEVLSEKDTTPSGNQTEIEQHRESVARALAEQDIQSEAEVSATPEAVSSEPAAQTKPETTMEAVARIDVEAAYLPLTETDQPKRSENPMTNNSVQIVEAKPIPQTIIDARSEVSMSFEEIVEGQFPSDDVPAFEFEGEVVGDTNSKTERQPETLVETGVALLERPSDERLEDLIITEEKAPQTLASSIAERIAEGKGITEIQQKQTEVLNTALPNTVVETLAEYIDNAELEQVKQAETSVVYIAAAADRLNTLVNRPEDKVKSSDAEEAQMIEQEIVYQYKELLEQLNIEVSEEELTQLITHIKSNTFKPSEERIQDQLNLDEGAREFRKDNDQPYNADDSQMMQMIAKLALEAFELSTFNKPNTVN